MHSPCGRDGAKGATLWGAQQSRAAGSRSRCTSPTARGAVTPNAALILRVDRGGKGRGGKVKGQAVAVEHFHQHTLFQAVAVNELLLSLAGRSSRSRGMAVVVVHVVVVVNSVAVLVVIVVLLLLVVAHPAATTPTHARTFGVGVWRTEVESSSHRSSAVQLYR